MKIRRILASTALAGVLGLGAMTGASALDLGNIGAADKVATGLINNAKCSDVRGALDALNATNGGRIYNKETTRNELVQNLRQASGTKGNPTDLTPWRSPSTQVRLRTRRSSVASSSQILRRLLAPASSTPCSMILAHSCLISRAKPSSQRLKT